MNRGKRWCLVTPQKVQPRCVRGHSNQRPDQLSLLGVKKLVRSFCVQLYVMNKRRLTNRAEATIDKIGPPTGIIQSLGPFITGQLSWIKNVFYCSTLLGPDCDVTLTCCDIRNVP